MKAVFLTLSVFSFQCPILKEFLKGGCLECQALRAHLLKSRPAHSITESLCGEDNLPKDLKHRALTGHKARLAPL